MQRFLGDYEAEHEVPLTTTAIAVVQTYLSVTDFAEHAEFGHFVPRVLSEAIENGRWAEAGEALGILGQIGPEGWSRQQFLLEIVQSPRSRAWSTMLDQQDDNGIAEFVNFAAALDNAGFDLVLGVLAEIRDAAPPETPVQGRRGLGGRRAATARSVDRRSALARGAQHRVHPGSDRNPGHGAAARDAHRAPGAARSLEAVNALGNVDPWHTRSIFRRLLDHRDPKVFVAAVTQLAQARDPELGRMFVQFITHPDFSKRSEVERRAVYRAVAQTGGPEVVRDLEAEIHRGGWLVRNAEEHRQEVARCLAAIGGHEARAALERALSSRRTPVRRAAEIALAGFDSARGREAA